MKVDTHMHSVYSDGTYLPAEIADIAKKEGLDLLALTDHNTVGGISRFASCIRYSGLKALAGMEITTEYRGREIHLLSYFPLGTDFGRKEYSPLTSVLDGIRSRKADSNRQTIENLAADYPAVNWEDFLKSASRSNKTSDNYNRMQIADYLTELGIISIPKEAFKGILSEKGKYYRSPGREDLLETVKKVVGCGGFPTVAHMVEYQPDLSDDDLRDMLRDIAGITREFGVEIFHFNHQPEHIEKYMGFCSETDADILYMAGSDCHGLKKGKRNRIGYPYDFELDEKHRALFEDISGKVVEFFTAKKWI